MMREDEYMQGDLIYCKRCRHPRERYVELGWGAYKTTRKVRMLCPCQNAAWEAEKERARIRENLDRIERMRSTGLQDKLLRKSTFSRADPSLPGLQTAKKYVERFTEFQKEAVGLLLWGPVGTGKTFLAACIGNALLDKGISARMTNFSKILNDLFSAQDKNAYFRELDQVEVLILDDLGVERRSEYALEQIYNIIDNRYRQEKPMILTTNLTPAQMKSPANLDHARIYDRILERCVPLKVDGENFRKEKALTNRTLAKSRLT